MEYQRTYYEELPQKIASASTDILRGISDAAEVETQRTQRRPAESVAEPAQKPAVRINMATLLAMALAAPVCLPAYGSLVLWAGVHTGSRQAHDPAWILRMPSGRPHGRIASRRRIVPRRSRGQRVCRWRRGMEKEAARRSGHAASVRRDGQSCAVENNEEILRRDGSLGNIRKQRGAASPKPCHSLCACVGNLTLLIRLRRFRLRCPYRTCILFLTMY
jgi:hypothetical protein